MRFVPLSVFCLLVVLTTVFSSGCQQLDLEDSLEKMGIEERPKVPDRMVCVWIDDIRYKPGQAAMRGFGGRIMFYAKKGEKPIKVDGSLQIYAFDDQHSDPAESIPLKEFRTPKEVLPLHYSKSDIGHSYSFFLDWDKVGGPQKVLTLIVRFEDASGKVVVSDAARQTLTGVQHTDAGTVINRTTKSLKVQDLIQAQNERRPGQQLMTPGQKSSANSAVMQASYEESPRSTRVQQPGFNTQAHTTMQTDTINLPPNLAQRLIGNESQETLAPQTSRPAQNSTGGWNTSVCYERPTGFARRAVEAGQAVSETSVEIPHMGRLGGNVAAPVNATVPATEPQASSSGGQPSTRFLSPRYQALRERLRRPSSDRAPSQPGL